MAKDPAFLFYPNDYMGGTMGMTLEEKGGYMDLLILQFNKGAFTIEQAKKVLGGAFESVWPHVSEKFVEESGKYFNQRLESEKEKRASFTESRRKNRASKNTSSTYDNTSVKHMSPHMENENENRNENVIEEFGKSENLLPKMFSVFKKKKPRYPDDQVKDFHALKDISAFICKQSTLSYQPREPDVQKTVLEAWEVITDYLKTDDFYGNKSLQSISNNIQSIVQKIHHESTNGKASGKPGSKITSSQLNEAVTKFRNKGQPISNTG